MSSTMEGDAEAEALVSELDALPLTTLHVLILVGCCVGFSFDLAEIAFGNILSAVFSAPPYSVPSAQLSWLLASVYIGAVVGAPALGWFADRHGRLIALFLVMAFLSLVSILAAISPGIGILIGARVAAGISLGAYPPLMFAYLTDILPPTKRGPLIVTATAIGYLGPTAFIFLVRALSPTGPLGIEAWRWGFIAAAAGAAACAAGFTRLPESPRWLISKNRLPRARSTIEAFKKSRILSAPPSARAMRVGTSPARTGLPDRGLLKDAAFLIVLYLLTPWTTVGFTLLSGAVLVEKGISIQDSLLYVGIATFGPIVGTLGGGFLIDRAERRTFLIATSIGMGVAGLVFAASSAPFWLVATALAFNLVLALFMPVLVLYASEAISTPNRAKLTSWAWMSNRVGSALVPLVLLPVLHGFGPIAMFTIIAVTVILFVAIVLLFGPAGFAGKSVK